MIAGQEGTNTFLQGNFHLDIRNILFPIKIMKPCNNLPRGVVESLSLEIFKTVLTEPQRTQFNA